MRGIVIAGTHSGCGKTTVTLGILAALKKKGLEVQPFKAGPDFIDAGLHKTVIGRPSRNLDQWMCGKEYVVECFTRHSVNVDIAVIEGVMGMYDGDFSTASLATLLQVPVILVVDAYGMAESAGAVVGGFAEFGIRNSECGIKNKKLKLAGVIFNRVASESHYKRLKDSVCDVPVLGYLPREVEFEIPHRHLGLTTAEENPLTAESIDRLADTILKHIDMEGLIKSAECRVVYPPFQGEGQGGDGFPDKAVGVNASTHPHPPKEAPPLTGQADPLPEGEGEGKIRIAVAYDKAFSFYYEDNLDLLRDAGAEIVRFSPLADQAIPDADAVYIGGGYPEIHAEALSRNSSMLRSINAWAHAGKPMYAECGGLMYLSKGIRDFDNKLFGMVGVFPFETRMMKKPRLGYRELVLNEDCILGCKGEKYRGHEFHYSEIIDSPAGNAYAMTDSRNGILNNEGFYKKNTLASYVHIHFGSNERRAERFVDGIKGERNR